MDDWNTKYAAWKTKKSSPVSHTESPSIYPLQHTIHTRTTIPKNNHKHVLIILLGLITLALGWYFLNNNSIILGSVLGLGGLFIVLLYIYQAYEKSLRHLAPKQVLLLGYCILAINMILGNSLYSVEWAVLGFLLISVSFYDFKIDARFLILPALMLLGFIPFLLLGQQQSLAELLAIYVYYFLVAGVILQVVEYKQDHEIDVDFQEVMLKMLKKTPWNLVLIILGFVTISIIIANRFIALEVYKWLAVYLFVLALIGYAIECLEKENR